MISYDLGGNDGRFNVFLGQGGEIQRLAGKPICPFWTPLDISIVPSARSCGCSRQVLQDDAQASLWRWRADELAMDNGWYEFVVYHQHVQKPQGI